MIDPANEQMEVGGATGKYADVNGLHMYYETHGEPTAGQPPLVLLHGAFSATGTSFGGMIPALSATREVISVELQGHGRTADIDRPLRIPLMADDIAALIRNLGLAQVDILGYSMGAGVALDVTVRYPQLVRKAIYVSLYFAARGAHPGQGDNMGELKPEMLHGSPFHDEYMRTAPRPEDFPRLVAKVVDFNSNLQDWTDDQIRAIQAPVMVVIGDSDIVQPEHAVEMFRLLGGGVIGDLVGLPRARLAILPGTTHITVAYRGDWLVPMVTEFLDTPVA